MKRLLYLIALIAFLGISCEEIGPEINPRMGPPGGPDDTTTTNVDSQKRQVIIEEFTGVRCVNCPAGSEAIQNLIGTYGEQLVTVSIHAGSFSPPYNASIYDFRTSEGTSLLSYLGEPLGFPTAVVNRKKFDGEFDLQLGQSLWPGYIAEELMTEPKVKIDIQPSFNPANNALKVDVILYVQEDIFESDVRLSLMVTEDDIEDVQLTPNGAQDDYKHKHVLRGMLTPFDGTPITEPLIADTQIAQTFNFTVPSEWVVENGHIIAVVSQNGENKDVYQAHEEKIME